MRPYKKSKRITISSIFDSFFTPLINLLFYGNFWIAVAAMCMVLQTQLLLSGQFYFSPFVAFIFFGTHFLYAIHRIVGLNKVTPFQEEGRYFVIAKFKSHITFYAFISGIATFALFWYLPLRWNWMLFVPGGLSLAYVLPLMGNKKRLRDYAFIKIFLIAIVWAWTTVILTVVEETYEFSNAVLFMFAERAFFLFGITLPFDIRDHEIDQYTGVKTIPGILGIPKTQGLAGLSLALCIFFSCLNFHHGFYQLADFLALTLSAVSTFLIVYYAPKVKHDYYFTGLIDGTMIIQFVLVWAFS